MIKWFVAIVCAPAVYLCSAQDYAIPIDEIKLYDRDIPSEEEFRGDTVRIELPLAHIKNNKLKRLIDSFMIDAEDSVNNHEPMYLYMSQPQKSYYEFWKIIPEMGFDEKFYQRNAIGFYRHGSIYIIIGRSAKRDVIIKSSEYEKFVFESNYMLMNVNPVFAVDLKTVHTITPISIPF